MEDTEDEHGNKIFILHPDAAPPDVEELEKLYRDKGVWLSGSVKEKIKAAHNECTASTFAVPKKDPAFL